MMGKKKTAKMNKGGMAPKKKTAMKRGGKVVKKMNMGGRTGDMMYSRGYGVGEESKRMPTELMTAKKGGKVIKKANGGKVNTSRMNKLEELGRVNAEKADTRKGKRNLRDEKKRIIRTLNKSRGGGVAKRGMKKS
mgnify:FL=1|tara:strand:- start:997 stop:1401 length:405 start_codon:yes stop_codon:yes gene_type:complete